MHDVRERFVTPIKALAHQPSMLFARLAGKASFSGREHLQTPVDKLLVDVQFESALVRPSSLDIALANQSHLRVQTLEIAAFALESSQVLCHFVFTHPVRN